MALAMRGYVIGSPTADCNCSACPPWPCVFLLHEQDSISKSANADAKAVISSTIAAAESGKLDPLIAERKKTVAAEPDSALAHFSLGYAERLRAVPRYVVSIGESAISGEFLQAGLVELEKAVKLDPTLREAALTLGYFYCDGRPSKAVAVLAKWLEHNPNDAQAMYWLGKAYAGYSPDNPDKTAYCHDESKCLEWLEKAANAAPDVLAFRLTLGWQYIFMGTVKDVSGNWILASTWRVKALEEFKAVQKLARAAGDADTAAIADRMVAKLGEV